MFETSKISASIILQEVYSKVLPEDPSEDLRKVLQEFPLEVVQGILPEVPPTVFQSITAKIIPRISPGNLSDALGEVFLDVLP